jgi:bis(5'-nucleosyl)-tetraphosphatase (symmetrical)
MQTRRHLVLGDLQGCRVEFERLLERLAFDPAADCLLLLGDLVNRGPDSLGCLRLAQQLGCEAVLGNHDLHLLRSAAGRRKLRPEDTLSAVLEAPDRESLLSWLASQPLLRLLPNAVLVHAALPPGAALDTAPTGWFAAGDPQLPYQPRLDYLETVPQLALLTRARLLDRSGLEPSADQLPKGPQWPGDRGAPATGFAPWYRWFEPARWGGRRAVFGHWAMQGLVREPMAIGLDTGCVWGGGLSAWIAEEDRIVSVPAERTYARAGAD